MTDQGPVQIPDEDLQGESTYECDPVDIIGAKNFSTKIESLTGAPADEGAAVDDEGSADSRWRVGEAVEVGHRTTRFCCPN